MHGPQGGCESHKTGFAITSFLLPCVSRGMNSGHHDRWQEPLPTEPSYQREENLSSSFIITLSLQDQVKTLRREKGKKSCKSYLYLMSE